MKGRGTTRAALTTSSFVDFCRRTSTPGAILFVDVRKAFDVVIREFLFGIKGDEDDIELTIERIVADLGLPKHVAEHLTEFLKARGGKGLIQDLEVPDYIVEMLADLHKGSWFLLDDSGNVVETKRGTRQGCRLAASSSACSTPGP